MVAGLEYARNGQTRTLALEPGWVRGAVQGTVISAYKTSIAMPTLTHAESERVITTMVDQAVYAAKLLAGELPANIEDVFAPLSLRLFPSETGDLTPKCNCRDVAPAPLPGGPQRGSVGVSQFRSAPAVQPPSASSTPIAPPTPPRGGWCKHACCLGYLVAERLMTDPFLIFTLRGLPREELLERLRQRRAVVGAGDGTVPVYSPVVPGVSDVEAPPLEECVEHFWELGAQFEHVDMPVERPEVSHPLLRRLGPSPFGAGQGKFPLVGLLATCYEVISEAVVKAEENGSDSGSGVPEPTDDVPELPDDQPEQAPPPTIPDPILGPLDEEDEAA